jgi:hypothetical protein
MYGCPKGTAFSCGLRREHATEETVSCNVG